MKHIERRQAIEGDNGDPIPDQRRKSPPRQAGKDISGSSRVHPADISLPMQAFVNAAQTVGEGLAERRRNEALKRSGDGTGLPDAKRPKWELTQEDSHIIKDIQYKDIVKAKDSLVKQCQEIIDNDKIPDNQERKYQNSIRILEESLNSIEYSLYQKTPDECFDYIHHHLTGDSKEGLVGIKAIFMRAVNDKKQLIEEEGKEPEQHISSKDKGPAETGGHISGDSRLDPPNLSMIIKNISAAEILDKIDSFIKKCNNDIGNPTATTGKSRAEEARKLIREEFENKSPESRERFIETCLNYRGGEQTKIILSAFFELIVEKKQKELPRSKGKGRAGADQPANEIDPSMERQKLGRPLVAGSSGQGDSSLQLGDQALRKQAQLVLHQSRDTIKSAYESAKRRYETDADQYEKDQNNGELDAKTQRSFELMDDLDTIKQFANKEEKRDNIIKAAMLRLKDHEEKIKGDIEISIIINYINNNTYLKAYYEST